MFSSFRKWFDNHFSHPDAVVMVALILVLSVIIGFFGEMLAPVFAASIIAYMLEGFAQFLTKKNMPRILAVYVSFFIQSNSKAQTVALMCSQKIQILGGTWGWRNTNFCQKLLC